jgi:hypothetical protein
MSVPMNFHSILKHGYWTPFTGDPAEVETILATVDLSIGE